MTGLRGKPRRGDAEAIYRQAAASERADVHTMLPAEIVSYDADSQEATVRILYVPKVLGKDTPYPQLLKVPVEFPRGGGFAMTWPIGAGDPGAVMVPERDMSEYYTEGGAQPAHDALRMHDLSDAVFVPGGMRSRDQAVPSPHSERAEFRSLDGQTTVQIAEDRIRACRGKFRFIANSEQEVVQLKVSPSDDPNEGGQADMHFTLDYGNDRIVASHVIDIDDDPNPDD